MKRKWFVAKTYGWGWTPATWEGWAVLAVFAGAIAYVIAHGIDVSRSARDVIVNIVPITIVLVFSLFWICYRTGERPRWRWGERTLNKEKMEE